MSIHATKPSPVEKDEAFECGIFIPASPEIVWGFLTEPEKMILWMGEAEMELEVITDWQPGHSILIRGKNPHPFENRGIVRIFEPHQLLEYSHLSSFSHLPDKEANQAHFQFGLSASDSGTLLTLRLSQFATFSIQKHLEFYWPVTLAVMKKVIEGRA